jgi:misacylated tRNA(Ala) deacylase
MMATEYLYQLDSYLKECQAVVTRVDESTRRVELNRTVFYPGGGGQPADAGRLDSGDQSWPVLRSQKDAEGGLWLLVGGDEVLPHPGIELTAVLDWKRRYQLMRTHTAMHILCGVVFRDYGALVTGGDMEPLKGRMDFEFENLQKELVQVIEASINAEVEMARLVSVALLPRAEAFEIPDLIRTKINLLPAGIPVVRVVKIDGLDLQADGGTHVRNTSEVGPIRVVDYKSKGKINKRIYVELSEIA